MLLNRISSLESTLSGGTVDIDTESDSHSMACSETGTNKLTFSQIKQIQTIFFFFFIRTALVTAHCIGPVFRAGLIASGVVPRVVPLGCGGLQTIYNSSNVYSKVYSKVYVKSFCVE